MKLSIVTTLYNSAIHVEEFCFRAIASLEEVVENQDYELILVDDGSPDNSLSIAISLAQKNSRIKVIQLARNFGHHKAMMTGLEHAKGERVFLIDVDLEERPEWLTEFQAVLDEHECDVVYGVQASRKGNIFEQISGSLFYAVFDYLTGLKLPRDVVTARLMKSEYVESLVRHKDKEVFIAGLWHLTGYDQVPVVLTKQSSSETTYSLKKKLSLLVNSVTSFSNYPLRMIFYFGVTISLFSLSYIAYLIFSKMFLSHPLSGWTSIMASVWLLGGLMISFLGVIGIYLAKVFSEVKDRPYTVIKSIYERKE